MVDATFTYDAATDQVIDATSAYGALPSYIGLYMGSPDWDDEGFDFASTEYCAIILTLTGAPPGAPWAAGLGLYDGFDYDVSNAPGTNCNTPGYELDPALWGTQIEVDLANYYGWGVGVGDLLSTYEVDYVGTAQETTILGGYVNNTMLPAPEGQEGYVALAFEVDAAFNVVVDAAGLLNDLEAVDVYDGTELTSAYYRVYSRLIWTFQ
jgi:hypothetical protein